MQKSKYQKRRAMLLAAGRGERMRPLTDHTPKPLVEVGGLPLVEHHLRKLASCGVADVVINHAHLGTQIEQRIGGGERFGLTVHYSAEPEGALETAGGIHRALPMLTVNSSSFLVVNADVFCDYDFSALLGRDLGDKLAHLVLVDTPSFKPDGDFNLDADGNVSEAGQGRRLTFSGISLLHASLFDGMMPGAAPLAPLLTNAMREGKVTGEYFGGNWNDVGTVERLQQLDRQLGER